MPFTPISMRPSLTSSSLNGLIIASIFFMIFSFAAAAHASMSRACAGHYYRL
jgi:hypothetical protein